MALEKVITQDKIEIVGEFSVVQVRTKTAIMENGVQISSNYHRHVVTPDADITGESAKVQAICNVVHTQAVKDAYAAHVAVTE